MNKPLRIGTVNKGGQGDRIYSINGHSITLSAMQSFVGLKIKMTTDRISEQNKELDADLQHLHSQGYTNIKKSDLRANTQLKQIESVLKNHQIFDQAIKHTINYCGYHKHFNINDWRFSTNNLRRNTKYIKLKFIKFL